MSTNEHNILLIAVLGRSQNIGGVAGLGLSIDLEVADDVVGLDSSNQGQANLVGDRRSRNIGAERVDDLSKSS